MENTIKFKPLEIAIDYDGTMVTHKYPNIGKSIGAEKVLKDLITKGHKIILYTMRSGIQLEEAEKWCKSNGIQLYGKQFNPTQHK
jgi:trehalose-6-phosphatase